jgi:hypothetical protein
VYVYERERERERERDRETGSFIGTDLFLGYVQRRVRFLALLVIYTVISDTISEAICVEGADAGKLYAVSNLMYGCRYFATKKHVHA